jgi:hypothetical protein
MLRIVFSEQPCHKLQAGSFIGQSWDVKNSLLEWSTERERERERERKKENLLEKVVVVYELAENYIN